MSEQPPANAPNASTAARALILDRDDMSASLRQIENVAAEQRLSAGDGTHGGARNFGLPGQEEVGIVGRQGVVERRLERVARARRTHQSWRDDDDEVGLVLLVGPARKQLTEHRHVAKPRELFLLSLARVLQKPADHEALAVAQLDRGAGAAHDQGRHWRQTYPERDRFVLVDLADLG